MGLSIKAEAIMIVLITISCYRYMYIFVCVKNGCKFFWDSEVWGLKSLGFLPYIIIQSIIPDVAGNFPLARVFFLAVENVDT